jgi:GT2 family glycosyltransferase
VLPETAATIDVSVIIVSYNTRDLLAACIGSVPPSDNVEIIVVDNGSSDGSPEMVRRDFPRVHLLENDANLGFVAATNQGIRISRGRYVLLLNSDAALLDGALAAMIELADATPRTAIVGARVLDEAYFMYVEEVDWCFEMMRGGWQVWYQPHATVTHHGAASSRRAAQREALLYRGRVRFFRKHYGNNAARRLKTLIIVVTTAKVVADHLLRLVTAGEHTRARIGLRELMAALRDV